MSRELPHIGLVAIGGAGWMGGANYVRNLASAVRSANPAIRISYVCGDQLVRDWPEVEKPAVVDVAPPKWRQWLGMTRTVKTVVERAQIDFLYPLTYDNEYNLGLRFPIVPELSSKGWAGWIPDFQHRYLPELFSTDEIRRRDENIARLLEESPKVVLSSERAAEDVRRFYPQHAGKSEVLRFAVPPIPEERADVDLAGIPARFFLVCNQFWKHKNHLVVFAALRLLKERGIQPLVLCTGQLDDYRDRSHAEAIRSAMTGLEAQVQLLGLVPRDRQLALMRRALAMIQPSLFEGWSTVVEDARVLGRPSLLSDLAVHREQNPPRASYFDPHSAEALAELMAAAWEADGAALDRNAESEARAAAAARLVEVGHRFLEIAERCRK